MNLRDKVFILMTASSACAYAQSEDVLKTVELNPITVIGTGTYHKADNTPVAVKVISAKDLKDAQVTNLSDALTRLTTNITTHTNGMGSFVNFNGVSDDYLLILENGKRMSGDDRWNRISMSNIKRIEILSGAASALYGSEAIAGVINIITDESKNKVEATNFTKFSSHGRLDEDINVDVNSGKLSSFTSYNHKEADNWLVNHYQEFKEGDKQVLKLTGRPMSVGFNSENISQKFEYKFNDKFSVYVRGNYYDYVTERPQGATYFTQKATTNKETGEKTYDYSEKIAYTYDLHHKSYTYGAGARWEPNKDTHIYLDVYSDNFVSKYNYWQTADKEEYDVTRKRTHYTNETLKGIFRLNSWNKLSAGLEFVQEALNSESDNIEFETTNTYNAYAQDEMQLVGGLEAVLGMRYTYNDLFGSQFTPNAGLFYHMGGFRLRASYAGGYRTPTLSQLFATDQAKTNSRFTIPNSALKPEKNDFWNANAEYSNNWMSVSVSGYINSIRNMINYRTLTQSEIDKDAYLSSLYADGWTTIRQRDNIDKAKLKGISANVKFILPGGFSLNGGYSYTDSKAKTVTLDAKTQQYVTTETPVDKSVMNVANVGVTWNHNWGDYYLNVNLNGHIQGKRYSSTYGYAPRYQQWDLNTRHTFVMQHFTLEPSVGIENLFNQRDNSFWNSNFSTINPGRSLYVSVALKFKG
ncbi:MAG: TonB-dependent receptor [Bacteroidaceae bacterium]|nr:TonB-dependent receptor [Bacteroidaceae bacterium]